MATTPTKPKLNAAERKAQVAKAEAEMKKHVKAFNGYRLAHDKAAAAKRKSGEAVEPQVAAKEKQRKGHNLYMAAYTRRKRLLKAT